MRRSARLVALLSCLLAAPAFPMDAAPRVEHFIPSGSAKAVRQVAARFSVPMVAFGEPRAPSPFVVDCSAQGAGHWVDARNWVYDFERELPAGMECRFTLAPGAKSVDGRSLTGPDRFGFDTGGPMVLRARPEDGAGRIDERQAFLLALDGPVDEASVAAHARCEVAGLRERVGAEVLGGEARRRLLDQLRSDDDEGLLAVLGIEDAAKAPAADLAAAESRVVAVQCRRPLPPATRVQLVWGKGIAAPSGIARSEEQRLEYTTRPAFTARLGCERVNPNRGCLPMQPIWLRFSTQIAAEAARAIRLTDAGGGAYAAEPIDPQLQPFVDAIQFRGPFPEAARLRLELPRGVTDDAGRPLANAAQFPLTVAIDEYPPLVKFPGEFGILEARQGGLLPLTVRNVEPALAGRRLPAETLPGRQQRVLDDVEILGWLEKVRTGMAPRGEWRERRDGQEVWKELTGSEPVLGKAPGSEPIAVPVAEGGKAFEVVALPLGRPGFYVVELASPRLGAALLGERRPRYVATTALVTDLSVHLKWGREASLVWVTRLADGRPVPDANVTVRRVGDGAVLWTGRTGADGTARIAAGGLPDKQPGLALFVAARTGDDMSFVLSDWNAGIQPWSFNLPTGTGDGPLAVHSVLDRTLLRAGETVSMKHYVRRHTSAGIEQAPDKPRLLRVVHAGSDEARELPLAFDASGIAESSWSIPADARLGTYRIELRHGDAWIESGSFRVEQFRLPTMRASVQPPAAPLVDAAEAQLDLQVAYLSGGGAGGLPVRLRTLVRPREIAYRDYAEFRFAADPIREGLARGRDESEDAGDAAGRPAQVQPLVLDGAGAARVTVPDLPRAPSPQELVAELEYPDPSGERLTVARRVPLWPAQLSVGIQAEHWNATHDRLRFRVLVLDLGGRPLAGRPVAVALYQRTEHTHRRRLLGGFYTYESRADTRRLAAECRGATGPDGMLDCELAPGLSGEILLEASAQDDQGRVARATDAVWLSGRDEQWFGGGDSDRMDVLAERREYAAGDAARLQVRMPFRRATALVTVEREGVIDAFVTELAGTDPVVELPVRPSYAPNVYVSVLAVRGRVAGPAAGPAADGSTESDRVTALVDLGKPAFRLGIARLDVGWAPYRLDVRVTPDREVYPVRGTAKVQVGVQRAEGGGPPPQPAEIAFAAVDEALLELRPNGSWKLLEAMLQAQRPIEVHTATAQMQVVGKRHFGRKAAPPGGGGGQQGARQLFDTLLVWRGRVPLDAGGNAEVEVPINDSLTAFRLVAVGSAGADLFGRGEAQIRTHQDLMLLSGLLPQVREGDRYAAGFTVRNASDRPLEVDVRATVATADGKALPAPEPQPLRLAPGEAHAVTWESTAPRGTGELRWLVEAQERGGPARDALRATQRVTAVLPVRTQQATFARLDRPFELAVAPPAGAEPGRGGVRVTLRGRLGDALAGVTAYMASYPYSCLEQRVSKLVALGDRAGWEALVDVLPRHQDRRGLFKFFASDWLEGDDGLTAYLLSIAHERGWTLPLPVRDRALEGLVAFAEGKDRARASALAAPDLTVRKLAAVAALARYGRATPGQVEPLTIDPASWPTSALLDWIGILQRVAGVPRRDARLAEAYGLLRARLELQGTALRFASERSDGLWWLMVSGDSNAARTVLAVLDAPDWRDEVPRLVLGAVGRMQRGHWDTTVANAWGALAVGRFSERFEGELPVGSTAAALGEESHSIGWPVAPSAPPLELAWPQGAGGLLHLEHRGQGRPWAFVESRAAVARAEPVEAGLTVTRTVTPVEQQEPGVWRRGDVARVRLEVEARSDLTWVVVDDPVPAGASILGGGLGRDSSLLVAGERSRGGAWPVFEERRFDAFRAYYEVVPAGRFAVEYTVRLDNAGRFALPPTRVEALYAPEVHAELPNAPVVVEGAR